MIRFEPEGRPVTREDWPQIEAWLSGTMLQAVQQVEVFSLTLSPARRPLGRIFPWPVSLHVSLAEACFIAEQLRQRGRSFRIERLPAMQLDFERFHLLLTLPHPMDYRRFLPPGVVKEGNILHVPTFSPPEALITGLRFQDLQPMLRSLLEPGHLMMGAIGIARPHINWPVPQAEGTRRWFSLPDAKIMRWLETGPLLLDIGFARAFVATTQEAFMRQRKALSLLSG